MVNGDIVEVHTPELRVVDHRGAGDAFTAVVAASHYWDIGWREAIRWGASAGALTVIRRGLATADRREMYQMLDRVELRPIG